MSLLKFVPRPVLCLLTSLCAGVQSPLLPPLTLPAELWVALSYEDPCASAPPKEQLALWMKQQEPWENSNEKKLFNVLEKPSLPHYTRW